MYMVAGKEVKILLYVQVLYAASLMVHKEGWEGRWKIECYVNSQTVEVKEASRMMLVAGVPIRILKK